MGKLTDWMMKGMGDDDGYDKESRRGRGRDFDNNFDRYVAGYTEEDSKRREEYAEPQRQTLPLMSGGNAPALQNVVLYSPKSFNDIQTLIDFLKRREPAVVELAGVADSSAQRILDFLSGAIYALSGSIHRISGSIFLLTPAGVSITVPTDVKSKLEGKK